MVNVSTFYTVWCEYYHVVSCIGSHGGSGVKNAWRINNFDKDDKWYILLAKNAKIKEEWMEAFKKERRQVEDDKINGL